MTFRFVDADGQVTVMFSFVCPRCGAESYNPHDMIHRYCGRCHVFVDDQEEVADGRRLDQTP